MMRFENEGRLLIQPAFVILVGYTIRSLSNRSITLGEGKSVSDIIPIIIVA